MMFDIKTGERLMTISENTPTAPMPDSLALAHKRIGDLEAELSALRRRLGSDSKPGGESQSTPKVGAAGSWELNAESNELFWTSQIKQIHEVAADYEPTLEDSINFYAPEYIPTIRAAIDQAIEGKPFDIEAQLVTAMGRRLWVRVAGTAKIRNGKAVKLYGALQDIDARKKVEEALSISEAQLRELIHHVPIAVAMFDTEMRYLHANPLWLEAYRLGDQDLVGKSHYEVFPEILDQWKSIHQRCLQGEVNKSERDPFPRADGTLDWIRWEIRPWYRAPGEVGGLLMYTEVITERVQMTDALATSQQNVTALINNTEDSIWSVDDQLRVVILNDQFQRQYAAAYGVRLQPGDNGLEGLPPDQIKEWDSYYGRVFKGENFKVEKHFHFPEINFEIYVDIAFNPIRDEQGRIKGAAVYSRDITERKRSEEAIRTREAQLSEVMRYMPMSVAMFDRDMRYLQANPLWYKGYSIESKDIIGKTHYEIFPEIGDDWKAIHQRCLKGEVNKSDREPFYRGDGSLDWIRWEVRPWYRTPGDVGGLLMYTEVITGRINAEDDLRRSEALLNETQRMAKVGGWELDLAHNELLWTSETKSIHEVAPDYVPQLEEALNFYAPEYVPTINGAVEGAMKGTPYDIEVQIITAKGRRVWVRTAGQAEIVEGKAVKLFGAFQDIDERKRVEETIRQSQQQLESTSDNVPGALYRVKVHADARWVTDYVSAGIYKLAGITAQEMMDDLNKFVELIHPDDVQAYLESIQAITDSRTIWFFEGRLYHKQTGRLKWWQGRSIPAKLPNGQLVFYGVLLDVTELKTMEAERERLLARTEALYYISQELSQVRNEHDLVERLGQAIKGFGVDVISALHTDPDERGEEEILELVATWVRDGNVKVPYGTRFPINQFPFIKNLVLNPSDPLMYDVEHDEIVDPATRRFLLSLGDRRLVNIPLYLGRHWVGVIVLLWHEHHIPTDDEMAIYRALPALISPVVDNMRLVRNLENTVRELNQSLLFKDQFLATMSHELRTPMNAIMGYSSIILQRDGVPDKVRDMLGRVLVNSERLLRLITDILDISRINAGRVELVGDPYQVHDLVKGWHQDFNKAITDKGLEFDFYLDPALPETAIGDEERVTQIANNLLSNAIKFTDSGKITLHVKSEGEKIVIVVGDTGIGIPQTYHHLIFEEFRQVDMTPERRYGGSGLGLAIVQKLCILMGGTVNLESEPGKGSRFTVVLPLKVEPIEA